MMIAVYIEAVPIVIKQTIGDDQVMMMEIPCPYATTKKPSWWKWPKKSSSGNPCYAMVPMNRLQRQHIKALKEAISDRLVIKVV